MFPKCTLYEFDWPLYTEDMKILAIINAAIIIILILTMDAMITYMKELGL